MQLNLQAPHVSSGPVHVPHDLLGGGWEQLHVAGAHVVAVS